MAELRNVMTREEGERYDRLVFDGARYLAEGYHDPARLILVLQGIGAQEDEIKKVIEAMSSKEFELGFYRGAMVDEGVIEALKDILRRVHGF